VHQLLCCLNWILLTDTPRAPDCMCMDTIFTVYTYTSEDIHVRFCDYNKYAHSSHRYGITLFDVITRGSQYRVEAVLMRVMKPLGYCAPSANKVQVAQQASIEVIPLVLEPNSQFYADPVLVLDFQSLYPSMILAYNLCYSTCLGTRA
jgi:DNA polymerase elongation subunit (family B)